MKTYNTRKDKVTYTALTSLMRGSTVNSSRLFASCAVCASGCVVLFRIALRRGFASGDAISENDCDFRGFFNGAGACILDSDNDGLRILAEYGCPPVEALDDF